MELKKGLPQVMEENPVGRGGTPNAHAGIFVPTLQRTL